MEIVTRFSIDLLLSLFKMIMSLLQSPLLEKPFPELAHQGGLIHFIRSINGQIKIRSIAHRNLSMDDQILTDNFPFFLRIGNSIYPLAYLWV